MSQWQQVELENVEQKDSIQLITILKGIITSQELKIAELEKDLKKWEKRYKQEFFKDSRFNNNQYQKHTQSDLLVTNFSKQLFLLQTKYDKKAANSYHLTPEQSLRQGLDLIEQLYIELGSKLQEIKQKNVLIEHRTHEIDQYKHKIEVYLKQFAITVKKSEDYQQKLLAQIHKLQQQVKIRSKQ